MSETIKIQFSKLKLTLLLLAAMAFVAIGIWFVRDPQRFTNIIIRNTTMIFIAGLAGILFFGFIGTVIFKKLFDQNSGIVISEDGIVDNSGGLSAGFIPWSDIEGINETTVANQKFIGLVLKDPQSYIARQTSALKRWAIRKNYKSYGAAIGISANGLRYNYEDLKKLLNKKFQEYKSKTSIKQR